MRRIATCVLLVFLALGLPATADGSSKLGRLDVPSIGLTQNVYAWPCERSSYPDAKSYEWGCAGENNAYLFGHAYGPFKALHDAWYAGTLRCGLVATFGGHTWRLIYAKAVWPTASMVSRYASDMLIPVLTLQTCLDNGQDVVARFVRVDPYWIVKGDR